jgi:hypothetical protein
MPNDAITPFILAVPQYKTSIDGLGIHFLHVRSKRKNALPLIITHGWPGSGFQSLDRGCQSQTKRGKP